jgi:hypothetical protein
VLGGVRPPVAARQTGRTRVPHQPTPAPAAAPDADPPDPGRRCACSSEYPLPSEHNQGCTVQPHRAKSVRPTPRSRVTRTPRRKEIITGTSTRTMHGREGRVRSSAAGQSRVGSGLQIRSRPRPSCCTCTCGCRECGHVMRPARTRARDRRAGRVGGAGWPRRRVGECGRGADAGQVIGGGGACCSAR